jgi:hypothetical protein
MSDLMVKHVLSEVPAKEYLIRKDGYFYRPNCQGYTTRKIEAGRYTKAKAEAEAAVEPWHMSAVHQDDVPDEPAVADMNAEITRLQEQLEAVTRELNVVAGQRDYAIKSNEANYNRVEAAEARAARLEAEREQNAERWLADKAALETCRDVLRKAKAFHDRDEGLNGFTADYEILRAEIDDALDVKDAG